MSYVTKNANLLLLFFLVLALTLIAGASVYAVQSYTRLNVVYDTKVAELTNITTQLERYQKVLENARSELQLKSAREDQFTKNYQEVQQTKEELEDERDSLRAAKTDLEASVRDLAFKVSARDTQIASLQASVKQLNDDVTYQKGRVSKLQKKVDCLSVVGKEAGDC